MKGDESFRTCRRKPFAKPFLEITGIHREINFVGTLCSDAIVVLSVHALEPQKVAIQPPKYDSGNVRQQHEANVCAVCGKREQSGHDHNTPALQQKRVRGESIYDGLDEA